MRRLTLHIGPPKPGTTALQHYFSAAESGAVLYPRTGRWQDNAHHDFAHAFFRDYDRPGVLPPAAAVLFATLREEVAGDSRDVLVSSEALAGDIDLPAFVGALRASLRGVVDRTRIAIVVREHFTLAASTFNERVKDDLFCETRAPDDYLTEEAPAFTYKRLFDAAAATDCATLALPFAPRETLLARFGHAVTGRPTGDAAPGLINPSLRPHALVLMLALNRLHGPSPRRARYAAALARRPDTFGEAELVFTPEGCAAVRSLFAEDRAWLAGRGMHLPRPAMPAHSGLRLPPREVGAVMDVVRAVDPTDAPRIRAALAPFVVT